MEDSHNNKKISISKKLDFCSKLAPLEETGPLGLLLVLIKYKKTIIGLTFAGFFLACIITLLMPKFYNATARILIPEDRGVFSTAQGGGQALAALSGMSLGSFSSVERYVGILKSRTIADKIIDNLDLMKVYNLDSRKLTQNMLHRKVDISAGRKDHIISISVEDKDPQRAAEIANSFVEELKIINVELNSNLVGVERKFLQGRLKVVKEDLQSAEEELLDFQENNKVFKLDDQTKGVVAAISRLKEDLASQEVELGVLLSYQTERNPQVRVLRESIAQLREQLRRIEQTSAVQKVEDDIFIPTSELPETAFTYARLMRDFKVQETLYEVLMKQFEVARVSEARNSSTIQVLDYAVSPDRHSKPRRTLIVLFLTLTSFVMGVFISFSLNWMKYKTSEGR